MKKIFLFLFCAVILSCNNDDDNGPVTDAALLENWDMRAYVFFGPEPPNLENGDVTWSFSAVSGTVAIVNNVEEDYPYLPESGVYPYTILPDNIVVVEGLPWGNVYNYEIVGEELFMSFRDDPQIADDELSMVFEKI
eukprot:CAMPEP_0198354472 /NCGR_PEP_ID=MMETSP1450-20131203/115475_1 /TAXON_ID=753684 ORGANISM="Madagascaria erythrocladiodes, Strain CCMP3234" /NCGR_SAMPLE_ID=MMETSP1450 /ASSEMBLY_ACC=CAM_ASM_001115 /LENGTH=136 /DNA_ID=CAMNT_0044060741 /DNA_START=33 /DNA_END=443 /DNA_ORIENTATION=-